MTFNNISTSWKHVPITFQGYWHVVMILTYGAPVCVSLNKKFFGRVHDNFFFGRGHTCYVFLLHLKETDSAAMLYAWRRTV